MIASVSVGTTSTQVLAPPTGNSYKFVAVGNVGGNIAYLKFTGDSDAVTTSNGIPLPPGGSFVCDQDRERELFDSGLTAIAASGATTTLSVQAF